MSDIKEKYQKIRPSLKDGDLILFRGRRPLARIIQHSDREPDGTPAYFNHIGIVLKVHDAFFIIDSQRQGVVADRLSARVDDYKRGGDFCVIQSWNEVDTDAEMKLLFARQDVDGILYDYWNGTKELANRRFGWNLKIRPNDRKDICSDFVYSYAFRKRFINAFEHRVAFPMDYIRHRNKTETVVLGYAPEAERPI